ncbi:hypothetical protein HY065_02740 [Candidatus Berkelbacteria bacterium]|nr:hypothetical protein [Candidatus Berkelbacteria bacterium]
MMDHICQEVNKKTASSANEGQGQRPFIYKEHTMINRICQGQQKSAAYLLREPAVTGRYSAAALYYHYKGLFGVCQEVNKKFIHEYQ